MRRANKRDIEHIFGMSAYILSNIFFNTIAICVCNTNSVSGPGMVTPSYWVGRINEFIWFSNAQTSQSQRASYTHNTWANANLVQHIGATSAGRNGNAHPISMKIKPYGQNVCRRVELQCSCYTIYSNLNLVRCALVFVRTRIAACCYWNRINCYVPYLFATLHSNKYIVWSSARILYNNSWLR